LQLRASLYGLRTSGKSWYKTLRTYLLDQGLKPSQSDACLFVSPDRSLIVAIYVDDLLLSSSDPQIAKDFIKTMNEHKTLGPEWKVKNMGRPTHFLGLEINWNKYGVKLTHTKMIERLAQRFRVSTAPVWTPMLAHTTLEPNDDADTKPDHHEYRSIVGSLNYMSSHGCRPDVAFVSKELSRNLSNPSHGHMRAAKRAASYLYTTRYDGLNFDRRMSHVPQGFADADFANQLSNRRSTSGRVIMLYGAAVMWSARQQRSVALSTAEAEIASLTDLGKDIVWLRRLLTDLGTPVLNPTPALEDSRSAIKWTTDSASWSKTRHVDVAFHKLREWIANGIMTIEYCKTTSMLADAFTKALPTETHKLFKRTMLGELHKDFNVYHNRGASAAA
jgi:hypothetical protein